MRNWIGILKTRRWHRFVHRKNGINLIAHHHLEKYSQHTRHAPDFLFLLNATPVSGLDCRGSHRIYQQSRGKILLTFHPSSILFPYLWNPNALSLTLDVISHDFFVVGRFRPQCNAVTLGSFHICPLPSFTARPLKYRFT